MRSDQDGFWFEGDSVAVEDRQAWIVGYVVALDAGWRTRSAVLSGRTAGETRELTLEADRAGRWCVDGVAAPHLEGCLDVDLESSSLTNAFPVHRLKLDVGQTAAAPAAYVRAVGLTVERLEQRYLRLDDDRHGERYHYAAPEFEFECELLYDEFGLVLDYPGIAIRAA